MMDSHTWLISNPLCLVIGAWSCKQVSALIGCPLCMCMWRLSCCLFLAGAQHRFVIAFSHKKRMTFETPERDDVVHSLRDFMRVATHGCSEPEAATISRIDASPRRSRTPQRDAYVGQSPRR
jgi:hypothetical protein